MNRKPVSYTLETLPEPTPERLAELKRLEAMPDDQIDTSDTPELTDKQWAEAVRGRFLAVDPTRASALAAAESQARELFGCLGEPAEGGRAFLQPMRLNLLRRD